MKAKSGVFLEVAALLAVLLTLPVSGPARAQPPATQTPDAVVVTVTRLGPYPTSITHSAAPFVLWVVNRSDVLEDAFSVVQKGSNSGSLADLHSTSAKQRDHGLIQLPAGSYQLISQAHPGWAVSITIGAN